MVKIIGRRNARRFVPLLAAVLVMAILQVAGVASMLPFLKLVTDPSVIHENRLINAVYRLSGLENDGGFLMLAGAIVLGFIVFSSAFTIFTHALQFRVIHDTTCAIERRVLAGYMDREYVFFLSKNTAEMAKQVLNEVGQFASYLLLPMVHICAHSLVVLLIVGLIVAVDPMLALISVGVLGGSYFVAYFRIRMSMIKLGRARIAALNERFKTATELLGGIKPVKAQDCAGSFLGRFQAASEGYHRDMTRYQTVKIIPSYFVETVAFGGVVALILYFLAAGRPLDTVVPVLGLYAAAGYKLLPSMKAVFNAMTLIRYNYPLVDQMYADLSTERAEGDPHGPEDAPGGDVVFDREIRLHDVTFRYPNSDEPVVQGLSLRIAKNSHVAFVGATGSGKTTLVDIVLSLLKPTEGALLVDGVAVEEGNAPAWRRLIGYVPQDVFLVDDTVVKNIAFGVPEDEIDLERVYAAAATARLDQFIREELPEGYETKVGERGNRLSGGQRQRLGLARAIYRQPAVLILDEATSALDGVTQELVMQAIRALPFEVTILSIAHRLSAVKDCDVIFFLEDGRLANVGTYEELAERNALFREMATLAVA